MNAFQRTINNQLKVIRDLSVCTKGKEIDFLAIDKEIEVLKAQIAAYERHLTKPAAPSSKFTRPHCIHCTNNHNGTCIPLLMKTGLKASAPIGFSKHCTLFTPTKEFEDCYSL